MIKELRKELREYLHIPRDYLSPWVAQNLMMYLDDGDFESAAWMWKSYSRILDKERVKYYDELFVGIEPIKPDGL